MDTLTIRAAQETDLDAMAALAAELVRMHHALDPARFMLASGVEAGYRRWFSRELRNEDAVLLVADDGGAVAGYLYGRAEERDWNALLDRHAALEDILVREDHRGAGIAEKLIERFVAWAKERGRPRVVLHTAYGNERAQRLFARAGFRPTMLEMTREV